MTERQYKDAIKEHIAGHPGITLPKLMIAMPLPKVKPVCHTTISHILNDMVEEKEITEVVDRYPMSYSIRNRYYPAPIQKEVK